MKSLLAICALSTLFFGFTDHVFAQSLGNAGTIEGTVVDPTGAAVPRAQVILRNAVSGYNQMVQSGADGTFRLVNVPPNPYRLEIMAFGFSSFSRDGDLRDSVPAQ